jgi:autotransporter-associated beta strand protein
MKPRFQSIVFPALVAGLSITHVHAAPLAAGDKIGIDFGPTATTHWNNITTNGQSIAAGAVISRAGASLDGVSITTAKGAGTGYFNNNDGSDNWVGLKSPLPADFVDSVTTDIAGVSGGTDTYTITLGGLSTSLRYNVYAVSTASAGGTRQDSFTVAGDASYGPSTILRSTSHGSGVFHSFLGVGANESGTLAITVTDLSTGNNPIVNGILVMAVAPPVRWVLNGDGNWNTSDNWSPNTVPNAPSAMAALAADGGNITGPVTATLDVPVTLGTLQFNHFEPYNVAGANALTFDNAGSGAIINVQSGAHAISAPVTMAESLAATVAAGAALDLSGPLSDGGSAFALVKSGAGNLVLSGDFSGFTGLTTISAGTVTLPRPGDYMLAHRFAGAGRLAITGGGRVTLAPATANSHGATDVANGGTLVADAAGDLGTGGVGFDNGTLEVGADIIAGTGGWIARAGGGVIEVGAGLTLQGGGLTGTGAINKTGAGTWRIAQGGGGVSFGTLTVTAGTLDLDRNDTFGNHSVSGQNLVIESGALVTNGIQINRGYNTFRDVTLDGGELRVTGTARALADGDLFRFEAYGIRNSLTVAGTAASSITNPAPIANAGINIGGVTDLGGGAGSDLTIDVADVTGSSAADLTVSAVLKNNYTAATYALLANGLVKTGDGTLELTAVNRYTGTTSVEAGTLVLGQAFLADAADVKLTTGATLQLDFAGIDTIDELFIGGVGQAAGTWGRLGHPTAEHTTGLITGDGLLEVTTAPPAGYAGWASGFLPAFSNTAADIDFENDGLASGIEWVVGGDPTLNDATTVAPDFDNTTDPNNFLFAFRRRDEAAADPKTTIVVEYGSDLTGWTPAQNGVNGVSIDASTDLGGGFHQVTVAIPRTLAAGGKLFARLRVAVAP